MRIERCIVKVLAGVDEIVCDVYGHEIPILVHVHGGTADKVRLISRGVFAEIDDPEAEYDRLSRAYRSDRNGVPRVEAVYHGGPLVFGAVLKSASDAIDGLEQREQRRHAHDEGPDAPKIQPKQGDPGYLDKSELAAMLGHLRGEELTPAQIKSTRRDRMRGELILEIEDALVEQGLKVPALETDRDLAAAFATYKNHLEAEGAGSGTE